LADLPIKLSSEFFGLLFGSLPPIGEYAGQFLKKLLSPLSDLMTMNPILAGQLGNALFTFNRLKSNLGLEGSIIPLARVSYRPVPPSGSD
jgi:hypothetical protein